MQSLTLRPGTELNGYCIEKLLGEDALGFTYLASDTCQNESVVIKEYMPGNYVLRHANMMVAPRIKSGNIEYVRVLRAFLEDTKRQMAFDHANIVHVQNVFQANCTAYKVMEYCEGGCLKDYFMGPMPEADVRKVVSAISDGLRVVHDAGFVHGNIKPGNIMFRTDGTPVLKGLRFESEVTDAKSLQASVVFSEGYSPLERYGGNVQQGPWTDIYSLAATAYRCLTETRPGSVIDRLVNGGNYLLAHGNGGKFLKALDWGLSINPSDRPQTVRDWRNCNISSGESSEVSCKFSIAHCHEPMSLWNPRKTQRWLHQPYRLLQPLSIKTIRPATGSY